MRWSLGRSDRVQETKDPTAHAVIIALREAARRLGPGALADATVFCTREPCPMCVGALLESDVGALVFAVPNVIDGAAGSVIQLAQHPSLRRRLQVVSGIRQAEAEELFARHRGLASARPASARPRPVGRRAPGSGLSRFGILPAERCPSG